MLPPNFTAMMFASVRIDNGVCVCIDIMFRSEK